jgi:membrane associated rhomboid family serine protease
MTTQRRRSALSYIPGYANNAVLQLIIASGVGFVMLGVTWGIMEILCQGDSSPFNKYILKNFALPSLAEFPGHWWTLFIYGWFHFNGFMELLSNMLWLYCFGSVVQMLIGHRQVIPMYIYCLTVGGVFYLLGQLLPGAWGKIPPIIGLMGSRAGLMGLAAAAVTLTPKYRFYITDRFSIPILVVAGVFAALMLIGSRFFLPIILLQVAGAGMGFAYVRLLQSGYKPGEWMYTLTQKVASTVTPNEEQIREKRNKKYSDAFEKNTRKYSANEKRIDDILDKINQKGYNSLSAEEKEILMLAVKE